MKKWIFIILAIFLAGCSQQPDEEMVKEKITNILFSRAIGGEVYDIENITILGITTQSEDALRIDVSYRLHFKVDQENLSATIFKDRSYNDALNTISDMGLLVGLYGNFKAGESEKFDEAFTFTRSKKGWNNWDAKETLWD